MVGEVGGIDLLVRMLTFFHDVEILCAARTVVGTDELDDLLGQTGLLGHLDAVEHMGDDDLGALHIRDIVVRVITPMLVLGEIHRVLHLSDIVIQSTRTGQQVVASNGIKHLIAQISHLDGMLEGARRTLCQLTQQRRVGIV